ncbi:restriction endonuclease subunit S, partial [Macrococcoides caseolyticum]|uniref:restriction endonuclease subunit S n=1 Tax=Macrococcoides caseolyticum TaxID=69966 RepID=UPI001F2F8D21
MEQINTDALKKKILDLAIRGKLVEQDPNDEPASVLLEKIRAEKEELIQQKKIKRNKNESYIFKGDDGLYYEKFQDGTVKSIQDEIPFEVPEGWVPARIEHIITEYFGGGTPKKNNPKFWNGEIPWASVKDLKGDNLYSTRDSITKEGLENSSAKIAKAGDLIVASRINVGKISRNMIDTAINQDLKVIKININDTKEYFFYLIKTLNFTTKGTTVKGMTNEEFLNKLVVLPPLNEQINIVNKINNLLGVIEHIEDLYKSIKKLEIAIKSKSLNLAMQGKLIPQNPNDEPASVLLEKVKEEKEKLIKEGKIKRNKKESTIIRRGESYYELLD